MEEPAKGGRMKSNDRLYMAAWLYHWYLDDEAGFVKGYIRDKAKAAFPFKNMTKESVRHQSTARKIMQALRDNPPKTSY